MIRLSRAALAIALCVSSTALADPPVPRGPGVDPAQFEVTEFASGLSFPYGMALADDGSLLVGISYPDGNYLKSEGAVLRLVDADGDGVADGPGTVVADGLIGVVTAVARAGPFVLVTSAQARQERIQVLRVGETAASQLTLEGSITFDFAQGRLHASYATAVRPVAGEAGAYEVFINIGSTANVASAPDIAPVGGLLTGTVLPDSIYSFVLRDGVGGAEASTLRHIATGLRNATGMAFAPDGALVFVDNGIDREENKNEAFSVDEVNRLVVPPTGAPEADPLPDFGFPTGYTEYRTGTVVGGGLQPIQVFQPFGEDESEGPAALAIAPPRFPPALAGGVFIGFHGKFDDHGPTNEENPVVFASLDGTANFHFIGVDEPDIAHIDGLLATDDTLYLSDLSGTGSLFVDVGATGVIYRIRAIRLRADANGDGRVDEADLDAITAHFAQPSGATQADGDLDGDGDVDQADVLIWATHFGRGTPGGRREPSADLFATRSLAAPATSHVAEITQPIVQAAEARVAALDEIADRSRSQRRELAALRRFLRRQTRPSSRVRGDFGKLVDGTRTARNLGETAVPVAALDEALRRAQLAIEEQLEAAEELLAAVADLERPALRAVRASEGALARVAQLRERAADATDMRRRAAFLRAAFTRAEATVTRLRRLLSRRGAEPLLPRVRSGDLIGIAGARVAVSRAADSPIAGVSLLVPAGALAGLQTIELSSAADLPGDTAGPAVRVSFSDMTFAAPAVIRIPLELPPEVDPAALVLLVQDSDGVVVPTAVTANADGTLQAEILGEGTYQLAILP